jgi:hypothetical protein
VGKEFKAMTDNIYFVAAKFMETKEAEEHAPHSGD